jgi:hypothetical protein
MRHIARRTGEREREREREGGRVREQLSFLGPSVHEYQGNISFLFYPSMIFF